MKNYKQKEIHILVTGVGRRVELLQAFRQAALKLNIDLKIYGADILRIAIIQEECARCVIRSTFSNWLIFV